MRLTRTIAPLALLSLASLASLVACGGSPGAQTVLDLSAVKGTPPARRGTGVVTGGAMPADVDLYAELSGPRALFDTASKELGGIILGTTRTAIARSLGVPEDLAGRLVDAATSLHFGAQSIEGRVDATTSVIFADAQPMRDAIARGAFTEDATSAGERRLKLKNDASTLAWFDTEHLLVIARDSRALDRVAAVVSGAAPALSEAKRGAPVSIAPAARVFVSPALLSTIGDRKRSFSEPLTIAYDPAQGGLRGSYRIALTAPRGADLSPAAARPLTLARSLPGETMAYVALSTKLTHGLDSVRRLVMAAADGGLDIDRAFSRLDSALTLAGASLSDLVGALGAEGAIAAVVPRGVSAADLQKRIAIVWLQEVADPKPFEALLQTAPARLKLLSSRAKFTVEPDGFGVTLIGSSIDYARVRLQRGRFSLAFGEKELVERALASIQTGKDTLADDPAHERTMSALPKPSQLRAWVDAARVFDLGSTLPDAQKGLGASPALPQGPSRLTSAFALSTSQQGDRARVELEEIDGLGTFAPLAVFGVRRYLANAKVAEAKNTLGAIARAAVASYERETMSAQVTAGPPVHALCKSAQSVPAAVPRGTKHVPSTKPGADWTSGDDTTGWRCLKMELSWPHYYRYSYVVGGPYKGPARGGPDPGPNGFEAAAEGDLDGDGTTSLLTLTGKIDPTTGAVVLSPMFMDHELE